VDGRFGRKFVRVFFAKTTVRHLFRAGGSSRFCIWVLLFLFLSERTLGFSLHLLRTLFFLRNLLRTLDLPIYSNISFGFVGRVST
jgi:hypothetical protein